MTNQITFDPEAYDRVIRAFNGFAADLETESAALGRDFQSTLGSAWAGSASQACGEAQEAWRALAERIRAKANELAGSALGALNNMGDTEAFVTAQLRRGM